MVNFLSDAASPYLRQHADNPVHWYPWGPEAFAEARRRDVPVLVSIGYATCHWCHVMAHECFENKSIASVMNTRMVNIKVDREELPEVDEIYMDALQALTGRGGWPLNAFVDHDGRPFFAGTYFPPSRWRELVSSLADLWHTDRERIDHAAAELLAHLDDRVASAASGHAGDVEGTLARRLAERFDADHPGLGQAPKFPASQLIVWLLEAGTTIAGGRERAIAMLETMQDAGLHDRIGGGFHRYSTDRIWRVPHFEKMTYDNAQLAVAYAVAGAAAERPDFMRTAVHVGNYLLRDMRVVTPDGALIGFASAEDADDSGDVGPHDCREGGYYAVEPTTLLTIAGPEVGAQLMTAWDIAPGVPHIGPSGHIEPPASLIPHPRGANLAEVASAGGFASVEALRASWEAWLKPLRDARDPARRPIRDDKVLTDLNGLVLMAFATLGRLAPDAVTRQRFTDATRELASALVACHPATGLLRQTSPAPMPAFITDYGLLALGLIEAWRLLGDPDLASRARAITDEAEARLAAGDGGYFTTPSGRADLIRRSREEADGPYPAGQHALALANARLYVMTGDSALRDRAEGVLARQASLLGRVPEACPTLGLARQTLASGGHTVVIAGPDAARGEMLAQVRATPDLETFAIDATTHRSLGWPTLEGRHATTPTAWVCAGQRCLLPVTDEASLARALAESRSATRQ